MKVNLKEGLRRMAQTNKNLWHMVENTENLIDSATHPVRDEVKTVARETVLLSINLCITAMNLADDDQEKKREVAGLLYKAADILTTT